MNKQIIIEQLVSLSEKYDLGLDTDILERIVKLSTFRIVEKGTLIQHIGEKTDTAALVLDGITRCYYIDSDGNDITRGFAQVGTICMDEGFFGYPERICMWEALEESTIMFCNTGDIRALLNESAEFKDTWITLLESGIRYKIYRENGFLVENATERYLHFKKMFPELSDKVAQKHIATYLGITPETLSRIRSSLKE